MCDFGHALPPLDEDAYVLDTGVVRDFVAGVRPRIAGASDPVDACAAIEPLFVDLLRDTAWLPGRYQEPAPESGMGGGIGQWLLFRAADRSLSLFSLVVPPGAMTPVHDHLAWGLVGLYRGTQDEEFYEPTGGELGLYAPPRRSRPATSMRSCRRETTSTACGRPRRSRRSRSICSRTTPAASFATPTTRTPVRRARSGRAT